MAGAFARPDSAVDRDLFNFVDGNRLGDQKTAKHRLDAVLR